MALAGQHVAGWAAPMPCRVPRQAKGQGPGAAAAECDPRVPAAPWGAEHGGGAAVHDCPLAYHAVCSGRVGGPPPQYGLWARDHPQQSTHQLQPMAHAVAAYWPLPGPATRAQMRLGDVRWRAESPRTSTKEVGAHGLAVGAEAKVGLHCTQDPLNAWSDTTRTVVWT